MNVKDTIKKLGGPKALQKLLGVNKSAVSNYIKRNSFPDYALPIISGKLDNRDSANTIIVIICGGIAAYKAPDIIRKLREKNYRVIPILTKGGEKFITPLTISAVSEEKCFSSLFDLTSEYEMGHIKLARLASSILIIPASANFIASLASGFSDDLANTVCLASNAPKILCPAMNPAMWKNEATKENVLTLIKRGFEIIYPNYGLSACGETGVGRLAEASQIIDKTIEITRASKIDGPLKGKKVLVTSGPTIEPIDDIRFISNHSSGIQGNSIAEAFQNAGADVTLVSGPVKTYPINEVNLIKVNTADEMLNACVSLLPVDISVCAAAVSDWRVKHKSNGKLKKGVSKNYIDLIENEDILKIISNHKKRPKLVIGFAAETENLSYHAKKKLAEKNCDWILGNLVGVDTNIFGSNHNKIHFFSDDKENIWDKMSKQEVAKKLVSNVIKEFNL